VQAGAKAFAAQGCPTCHGGPGVSWAKFSEGLHPDPPDLKDVVNDLSPSQLFWVVKNGINMTGMPSFAQAGAKDDEIWSIVAFLKKLPSVSEADYKAWTVSAVPTAGK
jgi:mono/diheme cytochrome c family protein